MWYLNHDTDSNALCMGCYARLIWNPLKGKEYSRIWTPIMGPRRIFFHDRSILLKENPRKGICSKCGRKKMDRERQFDIHHEKYNQDDPMSNTLELCRSCHSKRGVELGQLIMGKH